MLKFRKTFGEVVTCRYHIDSTFVSTTHDESSETEKLLYDVQDTAGPMKIDNNADQMYITDGTVIYTTSSLYKPVKSCVESICKIS